MKLRLKTNAPGTHEAVSVDDEYCVRIRTTYGGVFYTSQVGHGTALDVDLIYPAFRANLTAISRYMEDDPEYYEAAITEIEKYLGDHS